jgi:PAS domain S-box-containing protein/putative nucleotidyltransferase with HDIG domain
VASTPLCSTRIAVPVLPILEPHHDQIPLRSGDEIIGLLQLNDSRQNIFTLDRILFYEGIGAGIGIAVARRRSVEALRESEESFRSYLENAPDGIYMSDLEGNFLYGNRKCEEITGYRREELIGNNFLELNLLSENSLNKAVQLLQANIEGKSTGPDEIELIGKEGRLIPVEINTSVVQRMGQRTVLAFVRDITERKQAEGWLLRERSIVDRIMRTSPAGISLADRDGRIVFANKRAQEILGLSVDEITGLTYDSPVWRITDFDGNPFPMENLPFAKVVSTGNPVYGTRHAINFPDGRRVYLSINGAPIVDEKGSINEVVFTIDDVTEQRRAEEEIRMTVEKLKRSIDDTMRAMAMIVEQRDPYTAGHQGRVASLAVAIAQDMNLSEDHISGIRMAGMIHDVGKMNIPAEILSKPTQLSRIEFELIKSHAETGYNILKTIEFHYPVANVVYQHHERIDGSGYPQGLKGDEILMEARIIAVADVVEAMASHRPYRPAIGIDAALGEIEKNRGVLYDNTVADACLRLFREKGYQIEGT